MSMTPEEREYVDAINASNQALAKAATASADALQKMGEQLENAVIRSAVASLMIPALVAEAANGDRGKLDRILSRTVAIIEGQNLVPARRERLLMETDAIVEGAETYFNALDR